MKKFNVIIIGAGAAGLMCAIEAGKRGRSVLILEKADKIGKKILISGGGRCNFTNMYTDADNFLSGNPHFCKSALSRYTPWDFVALLESHGLSWTEKTLGQLFCDQKSKAVVQLLHDECDKAGVTIQPSSEIISIKKGEDFLVASEKENYASDSLVIATGGPSIPKMGATDFALQVAETFDINTIPFSPALVPFVFTIETLDAFIKDLSGISTYVEMSAVSGGVTSNQSFKESILFTHRGISGPAALQISSYWKLGDEISINLFPDLDLLEWLKEQQTEHPQAELKTILNYKLPKRLAQKLCEHVLIIDDISNKTMRQFNLPELESIEQQLTQWKLRPSGTEGMRTAEVALGGVDTDELSSKTLETKKVKGLYFVGEAVDVTGHLGGHNFQWAWASAWCAGQFV
ncbi:NAD(P)/FAD-dependent oxidoreductase [Cocleimonas sp. KMM 6892]|uniref:NAD(P)/FAD-dependent oxidoreductase n=1 Tax=unclassified Cocleimonas TaxID=2639732 RepID=UPI002DBE14EC|nr:MULTISPECIES: NAD(P)/FAD-dependent oxidoreductase [unclassified Cocleimonas]MEB8433179.1 NAD(P)/FAD-dependent oxidoreductase [Cocleimonas sp. KMM 6892]MEC4715840.1 NAD(P)/FAD-dependent oxidoreductase [Cocleimonas sp. KMM 6895]MEC4745301.1 NAD(P)/FAD-dependent oxidoreductase [Cocleimonas sp. KMM 6896]